MRVWLVDDELPYDKLTPVLSAVDKRGLEHLLSTETQWGEHPAVRDLCQQLLEKNDVELTALSSPEVLSRHLDSGITPPHVVIFDWHGTNFSPQGNVASITRTLSSSFAYVQVYTHQGLAEVEPQLEPLRTQFGGRLLPAKSKDEVDPEALFQIVKTEYEKTIAGEIADEARRRVKKALEEALVDLSSVPRTALAALAGGEAEVLFNLVACKLRDGLSTEGAEFIASALKIKGPNASSEAIRRLQSIWYYYFPTDDLVRRGDILKDANGNFFVVLSAQCDLAKFAKKTANHLTFAPMFELSKANAAALKEACGVSLKEIGGSAISSHNDFGHAFVILPNVPVASGSRDTLKDFVLRCHALQSREIKTDQGPKSPLRYPQLEGLQRICSLAENFGSAVAAHIVATLSGAAMPDFPDFERTRLNDLSK